MLHEDAYDDAPGPPEQPLHGSKLFLLSPLTQMGLQIATQGRQFVEKTSMLSVAE